VAAAVVVLTEVPFRFETAIMADIAAELRTMFSGRQRRKNRAIIPWYPE
jgi:hypothetical protein